MYQTVCTIMVMAAFAQKQQLGSNSLSSKNRINKLDSQICEFLTTSSQGSLKRQYLSNLTKHQSVCVCVCQSLSRVQLFAIPWTAAHQAPLSIEFPRLEYWSGFPSLGDLPTQGSNPCLPHRRQILYHLSHQGGPHESIFNIKH